MTDIHGDCVANWEKLVDDRDDTNWVLWRLSDGKPASIVSHGCGTGGLQELRDRLSTGNNFYGGFLVKAVDQKHGIQSVRNRYVGFIYAAKDMPVLTRARVTGAKGLAFSKMPNVSVTLELIGCDPSSVTNRMVAMELLQCGGAHKPTHYDFGDGTRYDVLDFHDGERSGHSAPEPEPVTTPPPSTSTSSGTLRGSAPPKTTATSTKKAAASPSIRASTPTSTTPEPKPDYNPLFDDEEPLLFTGQNPTSPPPKKTEPKAPIKSTTSNRDLCTVCSKAVYAQEKISVEGQSFHKQCFKCSHCSKLLSAGNYASMDKKIFCKPHFKQLFASKGNYNFGGDKTDPTAQPVKSPQATPSANSAVFDDDDDIFGDSKPASTKANAEAEEKRNEDEIAQRKKEEADRKALEAQKKAQEEAKRKEAERRAQEDAARRKETQTQERQTSTKATPPARRRELPPQPKPKPAATSSPSSNTTEQPAQESKSVVLTQDLHKCEQQLSNLYKEKEALLESLGTLEEKIHASEKVKVELTEKINVVLQQEAEAKEKATREEREKKERDEQLRLERLEQEKQEREERERMEEQERRDREEREEQERREREEQEKREMEEQREKQKAEEAAVRKQMEEDERKQREAEENQLRAEAERREMELKAHEMERERQQAAEENERKQREKAALEAEHEKEVTKPSTPSTTSATATATETESEEPLDEDEAALEAELAKIKAAQELLDNKLNALGEGGDDVDFSTAAGSALESLDSGVSAVPENGNGRYIHEGGSERCTYFLCPQCHPDGCQCPMCK
ncbi:hypothetical protein Pelo_12332 [Pelomyxa schiedti]|nr:hypothetical protein Pelo_12332 [Pelomyxa schiedti]